MVKTMAGLPRQIRTRVWFPRKKIAKENKYLDIFELFYWGFSVVVVLCSDFLFVVVPSSLSRHCLLFIFIYLFIYFILFYFIFWATNELVNRNADRKIYEAPIVSELMARVGSLYVNRKFCVIWIVLERRVKIITL